jgi:hypothetical protein
MIQTVEAVIDVNGCVRLLGEVRVDSPRGAFLTVLDEPAAIPSESALLAEKALAADWSRPEVDAAWSHLQPASSPGLVPIFGLVAVQVAARRLPSQRRSRGLGALLGDQQRLRRSIGGAAGRRRISRRVACRCRAGGTPQSSARCRDN